MDLVIPHVKTLKQRFLNEDSFHDNALSLRGTTCCNLRLGILDSTLSNVDPIIMYNSKNQFNDDGVIEKFSKEFPVFWYNDKSEIDTILSKNNCDAFLMEKGGKPDGIISTVAKNLVNAISICSVSDIHGDVYAMGSNGYLR